MELPAIQKAYARWAPHYDLSFGIISDRGRHYAVSQINKNPVGTSVLEVGVGTGLSLPLFAGHLKITGIDVSEPMLKHAEKRIAENNVRNIDRLIQMDAQNLQFEDNQFDTITAMYIMSVVPNPRKVMSEIARVVKKGGDVWIVNHFAREEGMMAKLERMFAPICKFIGWHSDFYASTILQASDLKLVDRHDMPPLGLFQVLHFKKI